MNEINSTQHLLQLQSMAAGAANGGSVAGGGGDPVKFSELLLDAVDHVNNSMQEVTSLKESFQYGSEEVDLSQVMIASQKANVEFELMMQARNRLISAYQEIMRMQI